MGKTRRYKEGEGFSGPKKQERAEEREEKLRSKREKRRTEKQKLKKSFKNCFFQRWKRGKRKGV
jgi:hypothetical protein